jgi:glycerophosphoryl diester phosphodiesterase
MSVERTARTLILRALAKQPRRPDAFAGWYPGRPLLLAHRGDRAHFPENTVTAVLRALERGADGAEFDVRLSKDGVPVVLHDDTVDRTTHSRGLAKELTAAELATVVTRRHPRWGPGAPDTVPRLAELLEAMPDGAVAVVELKGRPFDQRGLEAASVAVMRPHKRRLRLVVSSFHPAQLLEVQRLDPELPLGMLTEPEQVMPLRVGLAALALLPEALHLPTAMIDPELVGLAHEAGMRVHAWRVTTPHELSLLLDAGVDGMMVDDVPAGALSLRRFLAARAPSRPMPVAALAG